MQYIFLSHDVDWRRQGPPLEHILSRKDRFEPELFEKTKPEDLYHNIPDYMEIEEKFDIRSTYFFRTFYENGDVLDYEDDIRQLQKSNWEIGLHTDPSSIDDLDKIRSEKEKLESITGKQIVGNRVHFLNYNSELSNKLEKLDFDYDSSLRYSKDRIDEKEMGYSRIHGIIEFPVTLMQKTLDLGRSLSENNVISVIWHDNVLKMKGGRMYKQILEFLTSQDDVEIKRGIDLVKILK